MVFAEEYYLQKFLHAVEIVVVEVVVVVVPTFLYFQGMFPMTIVTRVQEDTIEKEIVVVGEDIEIVDYPNRY